MTLRVLKTGIIVMTSASLLACSTLSTVHHREPGALSASVAVGDDVVLTDKSGKTYQFEVTRIDQASIAGANVTVPLERIEQIQVKTLSTPRTLGLVAATALAVYLAVLAIVVHGFQELDDDHR